MELRGISYSIDGVGDPRRDLEVIRDELHCTTVLLYGRHIGRLAATARSARRLGLDVWLQPRLPDQSRRKVLEHLGLAASAAETVRAEHGRVTFVAGCEHSLFTNGLIPGPHTFVRLKLLRLMPRLQPRVTRKLDALLAEAAAISRRNFHGPLTYAAAFWERVDWSRFDLVGVNLYRFAGNAATYAGQVRALAGAKPVVITEFGCCAYAGAEHAGPAGFLIVQWLRSTPRVSPGHVRDETVQATYLRELVARLRGRRASTARSPSRSPCRTFRTAPTTRSHDLDMAGFGVVKVAADDPSRWERKAAFHELARLYDG